jgi:hypothetical protein
MVGGRLTEARWRTAYASVAGTSHHKTGLPCQDAGGCVVVAAADGSEVLIAAVSDGAGTASRSEMGAALAVSRFLRDFSEIVTQDPHLKQIDQACAEKWLTSVRDAISEIAVGEGNQFRDYACTLLGAVIGPSGAAYMQIGDGAIVVAGEELGEYSWIFWPQHGEYANSTNFLTQEDAAAALQFDSGPPVSEIAIFSDGIERLVLDLSARTVHSPALRPIFNWLAGTKPNDVRQPSQALISYLGSEHVNNRTDDDKTLVMATRTHLQEAET